MRNRSFWFGFTKAMTIGLRVGGVLWIVLALVFSSAGDHTRAEATSYAWACAFFVWSDLFRSIRDDLE